MNEYEKDLHALERLYLYPRRYREDYDQIRDTINRYYDIVGEDHEKKKDDTQ